MEQQLERIATSLETLVTQLSSANQKDADIALPEATIKPKKAKKEVDPLEDDPGTPTPAAITVDDVHKALREYMTKNGVEKTKALMIKHGADAKKPILTSIPEKNFAALVKEIGA
jgi:hypothetical protein